MSAPGSAVQAGEAVLLDTRDCARLNLLRCTQRTTILAAWGNPYEVTVSDHAPEVRVPSTHSQPPPEQGPRRYWWWVSLPLLVALPECIDASISLVERVMALTHRYEFLSPSQFIRENRKVVLLVIALVVVTRFCVRRSRRVLRACMALYAELRGVGSRDQQTAGLQAKFYAASILVHRRMLGTTVTEIARALGISRPMAWFITQSPNFVPRPELLQQLATLFMLPQGWFKRGGPYGPKCTEDRLTWYHSKGLAVGYTREDVANADDRTRADMLKAIEKKLREELGLPREGGRHD